MKYSKYNYKYQLEEEFAIDLGNLNVTIPNFKHNWFSCTSNIVYAKKGYSWDGASGPTIDTKNTMIAALVHDILYQAIAGGLLSKSYRKTADKVLYKLLRQNGMSKFRASYFYYAVRIFGRFAGKSSSKKDKILEA